MHACIYIYIYIHILSPSNPTSTTATMAQSRERERERVSERKRARTFIYTSPFAREREFNRNSLNSFIGQSRSARAFPIFFPRTESHAQCVLIKTIPRLIAPHQFLLHLLRSAREGERETHARIEVSLSLYVRVYMHTEQRVASSFRMIDATFTWSPSRASALLYRIHSRGRALSRDRAFYLSSIAAHRHHHHRHRS